MWSTRICKFAAIAAMSFTLITGAGMQAATAESEDCYGYNCTDLNPADTNCVDDAVTLYSKVANVDDGYGGVHGYGVLEMRYSERCHSNWVRFTPWGGLSELAGSLIGGGQVFGSPWVWREGSSDAPRGYAGSSSAWDLLHPPTTWTAMVTADGRTCMSVDVRAGGDGTTTAGPFTGNDGGPNLGGSGQIDYQDLGNYTAGCFS